MDKITCTAKFNDEVCGCTYFAKTYVNEFRDFAASLHTMLQEVEVDHDIKLYRCIKCGTLTLPPIDNFSTSEADKKIYMKLQALIDGKSVVEERSNPYRPIHPGTVRSVNQTGMVDPANHGKFIPQQ